MLPLEVPLWEATLALPVRCHHTHCRQIEELYFRPKIKHDGTNSGGYVRQASRRLMILFLTRRAPLVAYAPDKPTDMLHLGRRQMPIWSRELLI
jgi:hypothetical protein